MLYFIIFANTNSQFICLKTNTLITCLFYFLFTSIVKSQIKVESTPDWVVNHLFSENPDVNFDDISQGTLLLYYGEQTHVPKEEVYLRMVVKITDNVGIQAASTVSAEYDPAFQTLVFHHITVKRGSEMFDKLNVSNFQIIQQESNAENYIYDGSLSAIMNLTDVRTGDIVDYSYSIKGFNPIHKKVFSKAFVLNDSEPVGKITVDVFSNDSLKYKLTNSDLEPEINESNGLTHYSWINENTDKINFENNTPSWKLLYQNLFVTEYESWKDIIDWGLQVYKVNENLNTDLLKKIKSIDKNNITQGDKIKATLDDCKDKSLLMVAMLNEMGIQAYPVLVNTYLKRTIETLPPSQKLFDHCVVKVIDDKGNDLWYDPTISNQGGVYNSTYFPNYDVGLVISPDTEYFDQVFPFANNTVEVFDEFVVEGIGNGATLNVKTIYSESEADNMRRYFKNNSISSIKKYFKDYYTGYYKQVTSLENPKFEDDTLLNKFTVFESYKLDSIWKPYIEDERNIAISFTPYSIVDNLFIPNEKNRKTEYALYYPSTRKHNIKIKLPEFWNIRNENYEMTDKSFYFKSEIKYNRSDNLLNLNYQYKSQRSYVPLEDFMDYYKNIHIINNQISYYLYYPVTGASKTSDSELGTIKRLVSIFVWGLAIIITLLTVGGIIYVFQSNRNTDNT